MAHVATKRVTLDEIWPELESGLHQLITNLNKGFPRTQWMNLYSYHSQHYILVIIYIYSLSGWRNVYNYCTTSRPPPVSRNSTTNKTASGASFVGEELYNRLCEFLKRHMRELLKVRFGIPWILHTLLYLYFYTIYILLRDMSFGGLCCWYYAKVKFSSGRGNENGWSLIAILLHRMGTLHHCNEIYQPHLPVLGMLQYLRRCIVVNTAVEPSLDQERGRRWQEGSVRSVYCMYSQFTWQQILTFLFHNSYH